MTAWISPITIWCLFYQFQFFTLWCKSKARTPCLCSRTESCLENWTKTDCDCRKCRSTIMVISLRDQFHSNSLSIRSRTHMNQKSSESREGGDNQSTFSLTCESSFSLVLVWTQFNENTVNTFNFFRFVQVNSSRNGFICWNTFQWETLELQSGIHLKSIFLWFTAIFRESIQKVTEHNRYVRRQVTFSGFCFDSPILGSNSSMADEISNNDVLQWYTKRMWIIVRRQFRDRFLIASQIDRDFLSDETHQTANVFAPHCSVIVSHQPIESVKQR
jgi:hypothetical protein